MMAAEPGVKLHLYGKQPRPGRKLGHVTALGSDLDAVRASAARAVAWLHNGVDPDEAPATSNEPDRDRHEVPV
jgi:phosphoribosylaminoimidazole carboxylase (NCAIR synthetase)